MKFWKLSLLTTVLFSAFVIIILYTACEQNACDNVTCFNGGSCNLGTCRCPTGYEDPQCQTKSVARYLGTYVGTITCNNGAYLIDSAVITADPVKINYVYLAWKSIAPKVLYGFVSNNESTYSIVIPDDLAPNYQKIYTVTLQGDKSLSIHSYMYDARITGDTIITQCTFIGVKH